MPWVPAPLLTPEGTGKTPNPMAEAAASWEDSLSQWAEVGPLAWGLGLLHAP